MGCTRKSTHFVGAHCKKRKSKRKGWEGGLEQETEHVKKGMNDGSLAKLQATSHSRLPLFPLERHPYKDTVHWEIGKRERAGSATNLP